MTSSVNLAETRRWIARRARGTVLEVGIGGGLNLEHYPRGIELIGIDLRERPLRRARGRAESLGIGGTFLRANVEQLPLADASVDTVVATFVFCGVRDVDAGLAELVRVLRPGGSLLMADHIASSSRAWRTVQRTMDLVMVPLVGEHFTRRPSLSLAGLPLEVTAAERVAPALERLHARRL